MFYTSLWAVLLAGCAPWSVAGEARLAGVGFHPVLAPSARVAASARLVEDPIVDVRVGPEIAWSEHTAFGHALSASLVPAARLRTPIALVVGLELPVGVLLTVPTAPRWRPGQAGYETTDALGPLAPRVGVALTLHLDLRALTGVPIAPYLRYEQALLAPFAENAGIPLLPTSQVGVGLELELPE